MTDQLKKFLLEAGLKYLQEVDLKKKTWVKRGGVAHVWIEPATIDDLINTVVFLKKSDIAFEIVGATSNCYFIQDYNPAVVISTMQLRSFRRSHQHVICEAGCSLIKVAKFCVDSGIPGFEGFIGLPGTVGGAVINNAGSYGSVMESVVDSIDLIDEEGVIQNIKQSALRYSDRSSAIKRKELRGCVIRVYLKIPNEIVPAERLRERAHSYSQHRRLTQESKHRTLGSIFPAKLLRDGIRHNPWILLTVNFPCKLLALFVRDPVLRQKIHKKIFFLWHPKIGKNVSDLSFNCFIWRDETVTDNDFFDYVALMNRRTRQRCPLEIEVKQR